MAEDLEVPWSVAFTAQTTQQEQTPLVSERDSGRILELDDSGQTREVGTLTGVEAGGEGGLLGIAVAGGSVYAADLRGERLREIPLADTGAAVEHLVGGHGRLRDALVAPGGRLWVLTNNTDGRGGPAPDDDQILSVDLGPSASPGQ